MLQLRSRVKIVDKTSALTGVCIKVLKGKFIAYMGDTFLLSVRSRSAKKASLLKFRLQKKFSVGSMHRALLIRSKFNFKRFPGLFIKFFDKIEIEYIRTTKKIFYYEHLCKVLR